VPVLVVIEVPGGSSELDDVLSDSWHLADSPPEGNYLRLAGPMDGGWRVVSLWDSRDQFETFLRERLHLSAADTGDQQPTLTFWDIEKVHHFD
jgi:hypothetical protein